MEIGVVIVTYNRLNKLKKAVMLFSEQETSPAYVIIVNNASTDGTEDFLTEWEQRDEQYDKYVITNTCNTGGAGGFYAGLELAQNLNAEWIWISDDDAFPEKNALFTASQFLNSYNGKLDELSAICGQVMNNGKINLWHRRNVLQKGLRIIDELIPTSEYDKKSFELNSFSYVGTIINKRKLIEVGLTNKKYFIYFDDTEHSLRLSKVGKIVCVPDIKIEHDDFKDSEMSSWKSYYRLRNQADLIKSHFPRICYEYFIFKQICKSQLMKFRGKDGWEVNFCAIKDCKSGKFGIHEIYRPG